MPGFTMKKYLLIFFLALVFLAASYLAYVEFVSPIVHAAYYETLSNEERSVSILADALGDKREVVRSVVVTQLAKRDSINQLIDHGISNSNASIREGSAIVLMQKLGGFLVPKEKELVLHTALRRNM